MTSTDTAVSGSDVTGAVRGPRVSETIMSVGAARPPANPLTLDQRVSIRQQLLHLAELEVHRGDRIDDIDPELAAAHDTVVRDALRDALAKLAAGTYGSCEACHEDIPVSRLEAVPYARLCVLCQQRGENGWDVTRSRGGDGERAETGQVAGGSESGS